MGDYAPLCLATVTWQASDSVFRGLPNRCGRGQKDRGETGEMLVRFDVDQSLQDRSWGDGRDVAARQWRRAVVWGLFRRFTHSGVWCRLGQGVGVAWPVRRTMSTMTTFVARNIRDDLSGSAPEPGYLSLIHI